MPTRNDFPRRYFLKNPHEGADAHEIYETIRWGNRSRNSWEMEGPEDMAVLGTMAQIITTRGKKKWSEAKGPYLAVGADSNWLYIIPRIHNEPIEEIPLGPYTEFAPVIQTDYYSKKGRETAYYYHEHEKPYPILVTNQKSGCSVILPRSHHGGRSYAVGEEGIIG